MSTIPASPTPKPMPTERRAYPRKRLDQLAYIGFGVDTGGVLLDISEEGLRCQIVGAVVEGDRCRLKFALPGRHTSIEADGEVVWANRSRQGGGVRLVSLDTDAREDLQQWLHDAIASPSPAKPFPVPTHARSVGAVHMPGASASKPTASDPVANIPPIQPPVASRQPFSRPIEQEPSPVAEPAEVSDLAVEAATQTPADAPPSVLPEEQTPPPSAAPCTVRTEPGPIAEAAAPVAAATECAASAPAVPASVAPAASVARKPAPQTVELHATHISIPERRTRLAYTQPEPEKGRFIRVVVLAGCIVAGIATLAISGFNPAILLVDNVMTSEIAPPTIAPPAPPETTELESTAAPAEPTESAAPNRSESPNVPVSTPAPRIMRPQPPVASAAAPNRPAQNTAPARLASRPGLALSVPRRRASEPASPMSAAPQMPLTPTAPPAPLMEMPALQGRDSDLPQPVADYRPPQLLSQVEPVYSAFARQVRLQGTVRVNAKVGIDGVPRSPVCVSGNALLCQMAFEAMGKWRYQPATSDGRPVEAQVLVSFNFQLR